MTSGSPARLAVACSMLLLAGSGAAGCATTKPQKASEDAQPLKNWALSRCLAKAYPGERAADDAAKSAAAYLEMSSAGIELYERIDELVQTYLTRTYSGSVKSNYNTMKCIDLFHGEDLAALILPSSQR